MPADFLRNLLTSVITGSSNSCKSPPSNSSDPKEEGSYYIWEKGENLSLSPYFNQAEFTCHCHFPDCKRQKIAKELVDKLGEIRKEIKQPLIVTSAYRCVKYQEFLRSAGVSTVVAKLSQHELGNAVDVVPGDGKMGGFEEICSKHFESIGRAKSFLHCDLRDGFRRWLY